MENNLKQRADDIFAETLGRLPADACISCCNADPGVKGGCFLRLRPTIDIGAELDGFNTLLKPISGVQLVGVDIMRSFCEGYNLEGIGYPETHPKSGGWVCYDCGYYLPKEDSVDSRTHNLPERERQCPGCHEVGTLYAV